MTNFLIGWREASDDGESRKYLDQINIQFTPRLLLYDWLQTLLYKIIWEVEMYGIKINKKKAKTMIISKKQNPQIVNINLPIAQDENSNSLVSCINSTLNQDQDTKSRI